MTCKSNNKSSSLPADDTDIGSENDKEANASRQDRPIKPVHLELIAQGRVDPLVTNQVTGWAIPGSTVVLRSEDGQEINRGVAHIAEGSSDTVPTRPGRFTLTVPEAIRAAVLPLVRIEYVDGRPVLGSPLRIFDMNVSGRITNFDGNVIRGVVEVSELARDYPVAVAAVVNGKTVAIAPATAKTRHSMRSFAILLPHDLAESGQRLVQVAAIGGRRWLDKSPAVLEPALSRTVHLCERQLPVKLAIKIAAPDFRVAQHWGDYHFANQIGAALQRRGWVVRVDCYDEWNRTGDDVVLVLRGRRRYEVQPSCVNMMWQISHPDRVADGELDEYDYIFVASDTYSHHLRRMTGTPVGVLHQATDSKIFRLLETRKMSGNEVLFVGNSRRQNRTMVKWCLDENVPIAVFGTMWDGIIPKNYIRGKYISNAELYNWYGSCGILLNDHWDTMRDNGFLSNRLFDGSAAGAFIISDTVKGLGEIFGDTIETATDSKELKAKTLYYLAHPEERIRRAASAREIVLRSHTFDHRADDLIRAYSLILRDIKTDGRHIPR